ncbi:sodium-dependent glucose transporter 1C-like [Argopecten irradians]|uniref:sodium-dependent glucose transporter 1C-like n=1 Tax=Argopecten irradians TaxID=31199 RepID=UPI0037172393
MTTEYKRGVVRDGEGAVALQEIHNVGSPAASHATKPESQLFLPDIPSPEVDGETKAENQSFFSEVRLNKDTRSKFFLSLSLSMVYFILGWSKSQIGPAFLDLIAISGVNLERGSWFMTSYYFGRLIGTAVGGHLYTKINHYLLFVVSISVNGLVLVAIPWCVRFELMVAAHALNGVLEGALTLVKTSKTVSVWKSTSRGNSFIQLMYAVFAISGILAPMATAPFLLSKLPNDTNMMQFTGDSNSSGQQNMPTWTSLAGLSSESNLTLSGIEVSSWASESNSTRPTFVTLWQNQTSESKGLFDKDNSNTTATADIFLGHYTSRLYIIYSVSATLNLLTSVPFVLLFLKSKKNTVKEVEYTKPVYLRHLRIIVQRLQMVNIGLFSAMFSAIGQTLANFITVFCVQYLDWTKVSGAMLTSFYVFATLVGNIAGVFLVRILQTHTILLLATVTYSLGLACLSLCALFYADIGIWVSVGIIGVPFGMVWPAFISWTNSHFIHVTGYVTSYILVISHTATMLHPPLVSYLMDRVSPLWFGYLCTVEGSVSVFSALMMVFYSKYT